MPAKIPEAQGISISSLGKAHRLKLATELPAADIYQKILVWTRGTTPFLPHFLLFQFTSWSNPSENNLDCFWTKLSLRYPPNTNGHSARQTTVHLVKINLHKCIQGRHGPRRSFALPVSSFCTALFPKTDTS